MNPLERIKNWLSHLDPITRLDTIAIARCFHPVPELREGGTDVSDFMNYLNSEGISDKEIVSRSLTTIQLINYSLDGKDTESYWREAIDKNLDLRNYSQDDEKDLTPLLDDLLSRIPENKEKWMTVTNEWSNLQTDYLNFHKITEWYFERWNKNK